MIPGTEVALVPQSLSWTLLASARLLGGEQGGGWWTGAHCEDHMPAGAGQGTGAAAGQWAAGHAVRVRAVADVLTGPLLHPFLERQCHPGKLYPRTELIRASTLVSPGQAEARAGAVGTSTGPSWSPLLPWHLPLPRSAHHPPPGMWVPYLLLLPSLEERL